VRFISLIRNPLILLDDHDEEALAIPSGGRVSLAEDIRYSAVEDETYGPVPISTVRQVLAGLPDPTDGIAYIVPWRVQQAARASGFDVTDLYSPDGTVKRDGLIIGSRRLIRYGKA